MVDSIENASVADDRRDGLGAEPHQHRDQFGDFGIRRQCGARFDPVDDLLDARPHQDRADLIDQRRDLFVDGR